MIMKLSWRLNSQIHKITRRILQMKVRKTAMTTSSMWRLNSIMEQKLAARTTIARACPYSALWPLPNNNSQGTCGVTKTSSGWNGIYLSSCWRCTIASPFHLMWLFHRNRSKTWAFKSLKELWIAYLLLILPWVSGLRMWTHWLTRKLWTVNV